MWLLRSSLLLSFVSLLLLPPSLSLDPTTLPHRRLPSDHLHLSQKASSPPAPSPAAPPPAASPSKSPPAPSPAAAPSKSPPPPSPAAAPSKSPPAPSPAAAPVSDNSAPPPADNSPDLSDILNSKGCESFATLLTSSGAMDTFQSTVQGGLTVFCVSDSAVKSFQPIYKNLTASEKTSLLLSHGVPLYLSMKDLETNNGPKSTLASVRSSTYLVDVQTNGTAINIQTPVNSAKITSTLKSKDPLAVYMIDQMLKPKEIFKPAVAPSPAPAPSPEASAPGPDSVSPDQSPSDTTPTKKNNGAASFASVSVFSVFFAICFSFVF